MSRQRGFSLVELLIAMTVLLIAMAAVLGVLTQGQRIARHTESRSMVHGNVRMAMNRLEPELRMVGFGVPSGIELGGSAVWTPVIFHASSTEIGFRADTDGGLAAITCTPKSTNTGCPQNEILLDSIAYYQALNCRRPDNSALDLPVILVHDQESWEPVDCVGVNSGSGSIDVSPQVTDDTFRAGESDVLTIEQVYYRYVADSQPPYGRLERSIRYVNTPDGSFPPSGTAWTVVADHLTDFVLEYRDGSGNVLSGSPLSAANRALVSSVYMFVEGFDSVGPEAIPQMLQAESRVLVRNAGL